MSLSNKLLDKLKNVNVSEPDKQLLLYSNREQMNYTDIDTIFSQFKWCLINEIYDDCYIVLKSQLIELYTEWEIDILIRRFKQFLKNN